MRKSDIIDIEVGASSYSGGPGLTFPVHRDVIMFYSSYFLGHLEDGLVNRIRLPDDYSSSWRLFCRWVTDRTFILNYPSEDILGDVARQDLIRQWQFGHLKGVPVMQNKLIDIYVEKMIQQPGFFSPAMIRNIFDATEKGGKLQQHVVDIISEIMQLDKNWAVDVLKNNEIEHIIAAGDVMARDGPQGAQLAEQMMKFQTPGWKCVWHVHAEGEDCSSDRFTW